MPTIALTSEQQQQFDKLIDQLSTALSAQFTLVRDTFMVEPLRYSLTHLLPTNQAMARRSVRVALQNALTSMGFYFTHSQEGKGVWLRDKYNIGAFTIEIAVARRGGRIICFSLS